MDGAASPYASGDRRSAGLRAGDRLVAVALGGALFAAWLTIYLLWPMPFWAAGDDYVFLSLSHALHFDAVLHHRAAYADEGLVNHPGIPFYAASWLALRAAALLAGDQDITTHAMADPAGFFLATRLLAGLITAAAVAGAWQLMKPLAAPWRLLAILAFFAASPASFRFGLTFLGNETFALPLSVLLFWALRSVATSPPGAHRPWLLLGAVAGLGYTVKLLYLDILAAALAVAAVDSWWIERHAGWRFIGAAVQRGTLVVAGFLALAGALLVAVLGRSGLLTLLAFHASIVAHQGSYGTGEIGVVSVQLAYDALAHKVVTMALPYLFGLAVVLPLVALVAQMRTNSLDRAAVLWTTAALTAMVAAAAAVLKHYSTHYLTAISAVLPFALAPILARHRTGWIAGVGVVGSLCFTAIHAAGEFSKDSAGIAAIADDESAIAAMPLLPGEARLWTYGVRSKHFAAGFVAHYSGVTSLITAAGDPAQQDISSFSRVDRPYRYVVVDRDHYRDADAVRQQKGSLEPTQSFMARVEPDDTIHVLKHLIVVERAAR